MNKDIKAVIAGIIEHGCGISEDYCTKNSKQKFTADVINYDIIAENIIYILKRDFDIDLED